MTLLAPPEVKARDVLPLDFSNRNHRAILFDLAVANQQHLLNDVDNDIPLIIYGYEQRQAAGEVFAFIAVVDDQPAGCFWIEVDRYGIGRLRGALLPEYRDAWNGAFFLRLAVQYAFEGVGIRKLECELALYPKLDRESATAERLLKRIGFNKRAILPESLMIGGRPKDTILLDYLKRDYDVKGKQQ